MFFQALFNTKPTANKPLMTEDDFVACAADAFLNKVKKIEYNFPKLLYLVISMLPMLTLKVLVATIDALGHFETG